MRRLIFQLILCLSPFFASAQSKADSLIATVSHLPDSIKVRDLNLLANKTLFSDIALSRQLTEHALAVSVSINSLKGEASSATQLCAILNQQGQFVKALEMCERAQVIYIRLNDKTGMAVAYNNTGMVYNQQGQYAQALENLTEALKIRQVLNQKDFIASTIENIGIIHFRQGDYQLALDYFKESYENYKLINNSAGATKILVNLGATYNRLKMPAKALEAHKQSLAYFEETNNVRGKGIAYNNMGTAYSELKDYKKAIDFFRKSLEQKQKLNDKAGLSITLQNIAEGYLNLNDLEKAKEHIDQSLKIAEEIGAKEQIKDAYNILSKVYEKSKDYEKALKYEKKLTAAKDSLFSSDKTEQISRMRAMYETEKAEQQAALAKMQTAQKEADLALLNKDNEIKSKQRNFLIAVASSLFMAALLVFYLYQQKQKSNALLVDKNAIIEKSLLEREALLKEIHHRVKNNLQIISSLLSLQSKTLNDAGAQGAITESRNRVKSMSLIHEQLYKEDTISGVDMKDYIQRLVNSLTSSYGLDTDRVEIKVMADDILLDVDSAIPLGLIINELVSNSVKYAFPELKSGTILISLRDMMNELRLTVQDDGVGMSINTQNDQSFGLSMINSLMRKLKAEMNIVSSAGTSVELVIKDFKKVSFV